MNTLRLDLGPGPGDRLLAVGLPDRMEMNANFMAWTIGDGTFVASGSSLLFIETGPDPILRIGGDSCTLGFMEGPTYRLVRVGHDLSVDTVVIPGHPVSIGADVVIVRHGSDTLAFRVPNMAPVQLPVGARDGKPQAFASGCGVLWLDGTQVMRLGGAQRASVAGRLIARPEAWRPGPLGSAVFSVDGVLWGLAPNGTIRKLGQYDMDCSKFRGDGERLLAIGPDGVAELDLRLGTAVASKTAALMPAGFTNEPVVLDEDVGVLRTLAGQLLMDGLAPSAVCCSPTTVFGPGGTAWDANTGRRTWKHAPLCAEHLVAIDGGVVQIGDRITVFDENGASVQDFPLPIDPEIDGEIMDVAWRDGHLCFAVAEDWVVVDFSGRRIGHEASRLEEPRRQADGDWAMSPGAQLSTETRSIPISIDGYTIAKDGRALAWSEDGLLLQLAPG